MTSNTHTILTSGQRDIIFENMSDGVMTVNSAGVITYLNSACAKILGISDANDIIGMSFHDSFLLNKKNLSFNKLFNDTMNKNKAPEKTDVRYRINSTLKHLNIDISLIQTDNDSITDTDGVFPGMLILIEDITDRFTLREQEHDCAYIFAGLIICISLFLFTWSLLRFTLHIYLKSSTYTFMTECITFALFLEIVFMTSLSMRDIGLVPKIGKIKSNIYETLIIAVVSCVLLLLSKVILNFIGIRIKSYFIGGSFHGAYVYIFTSFVQEFLARGVIQTSVKRLMRVKYQKAFGIMLTSLLFSLMHIPFGFYFMLSSLILSLLLGYIYERQGNIWGCVFLHWCCGYLTMCLYF